MMTLKKTLLVILAGCLSVTAQAYTEEEMEMFASAILAAKDSSTHVTRNMKQSLNATASNANFGSTLELALARMRVNEQVTPETTALFGDKVDLNSGSISFTHNDISIRGNSSLPVGIQRTYKGSTNNYTNNSSFGDWSLDIPSITSTTIHIQRGRLTAINALTHLPNCNSLPPGYFDVGFATVGAASYWSGDSLDIPGVINEKLRETNSAEQALGYGKRIAGNWRINCLSGKYGFTAISPEGTTYTFDVVSLTPATKIRIEQEGEIWNPDFDAYEYTQVYTIAVQASRIEDRFGNWVTFEYEPTNIGGNLPNEFLRYSNKLIRIESSDARIIEITYEQGTSSERIKQIAENNLVWRYGYQTYYNAVDDLYKDKLSTVTRPDGKRWIFNLNYGLHGGLTYKSDALNDCRAPGNSTITSTLEHPDGALFTLTHRPTLFGRTQAPSDPDGGARCFSNLAVIKKELNFNQENLVWNYAYSQNAGSPKRTTTSTPQPAALSGLPLTPEGTNLMDLRSTTVSNPDGSKTIHVINRSYTALEGQEVMTLYYDTNSSDLLRAVERTFHVLPRVGRVRLESCKPNHYPLTRRVTCADLGYYPIGNNAMHNNHTYLNRVRESIFSNGTATTYTTTHSNYNTYGQPGLITETGPSGTRYKRLSYQHDTSLWILNLPTTTELSTNNSSWTTASQTTYYAANTASKLLPHQEYQFGTLISTNTYHTTGTAAGNLKRLSYNLANRWVEFNNYKRGIPQQISLPGRYTAAATQTATQSVNDRGEVTSVTNFPGHTTGYGYDVMSRVTRITPPSPWAPTTLTYTHSGGRFIQTITRGTYQKRIEMDALFRPLLTRERDTARNINVYVRQQFDAYNQPVFTSFPSGSDTESNGWATEYDGLQRVKRQYSTVDNTGVDYYYLTGNRVETVDALSNRTTTTYRAFGAPEQKLPTLISQPEGVRTTLVYNLFDNVASITQGGVTESRFYNAQQRLCRLYRPDVGATAYEYNTVGNVTWEAKGASGANNACATASVLASEKTSFSYDNLGNIRQITYPDSSGNSVYTYDNQGNLTRLTSGSTAWEYEYTSQGLVDKETLLVDNLAFVLDPTYNAMEQLTSLSYPSGRSITFTVDALGRTLSSGSYATNAQYFPNGQLKSFNYGNSLTFNQTLDNHQRPELRRVSKTANMLSHQYSYDANNNLKSIIDAVTPANSITNLTYDGLNRLKTANGFWGTGSVDYDALGNISRKALGAQDISYTYNSSNRLASLSGSVSQSFSYDSRGNVTNNGVRGFTFNRANRLVSSGTNSYVYDGHGRRIIKNKNGAKTYSLYNSAGVLMSTYENNGYTDYYYLGRQLVAKYADPNTQSDEPGYTGHVEDNDLQLTYMQQRYYDPIIGRFYSNDPVGFTASNPMMFNRYAYANNNPYKFVDPDGRQSELKFEMPSVSDKLANMFGLDNASHGNQVVEAKVESALKSVDAAANAVGDRVSVTAQGTAGLGLGVNASAEVDSATFKGDGVKLGAGLTGTAYGASAGVTANLALIQADKSATGPITNTSIMAGSGLGGGATIQWTPSFGVTLHAGPVAGVSISSTVAGAETRVGEIKKD